MVTVGLIMATAFCQIMSKIYYIIYKLSWNLEQNVRHEILFAWPIKILNRMKIKDRYSKNKITYCQDKYHRSHKGPDGIGLHIEPAMIVCFVFVHGYHQGYSNNQNRHTWKQFNNRTTAYQIILWVILSYYYSSIFLLHLQFFVLIKLVLGFLSQFGVVYYIISILVFGFMCAFFKKIL